MESPLPRTICRARTTETVFHGLKTSLAGVAKAKTRRRRFTSEWEEAPPELGGRHNVAKECCSWRRTKCAGFEHTSIELYAYTSTVSASVTDALIVHCVHLFPFVHCFGFSIPRLGRKADGDGLLILYYMYLVLISINAKMSTMEGPKNFLLSGLVRRPAVLRFNDASLCEHGGCIGRAIRKNGLTLIQQAELPVLAPRHHHEASSCFLTSLSERSTRGPGSPSAGRS